MGEPLKLITHEGGGERRPRILESDNGGVLQLMDECELDNVFENITGEDNPSVGKTACGQILNIKAKETNFCFETGKRNLIQKTQYLEEGMNEVVMLLVSGENVAFSKTVIDGKPAIKLILEKVVGKDLRLLRQNVEEDLTGSVELLQTAVITTLQTLKAAAEQGILVQDVQPGQMVGIDRLSHGNEEILAKRRRLYPNLPRFGLKWVDYSTTKYCGYNQALLEGTISSLKRLSDEELKAPSTHQLDNFNRSINTLENIFAKPNFDNYDIEDVRSVLLDLEGSFWGGVILEEIEDQIGHDRMKRLIQISEMAAKPNLINKIWQMVTGQVDTGLWRMVIPEAQKVSEVFMTVKDKFEERIKKPSYEIIASKVIRRNVETALAQFPGLADDDWKDILSKASAVTSNQQIPTINVDEEFDLRELRKVRKFDRQNLTKVTQIIEMIGQRRDYYLLFGMAEEIRLIEPQLLTETIKRAMSMAGYNEDNTYVMKAKNIRSYLGELISIFPDFANTAVMRKSGSAIGENDVHNVLSKMESVIARIEADRREIIDTE